MSSISISLNLANYFIINQFRKMSQFSFNKCYNKNFVITIKIQIGSLSLNFLNFKMEQYIDEMLQLINDYPKKAQELCSNLIHEHGQNFFKCTISKIQSLQSLILQHNHDLCNQYQVKIQRDASNTWQREIKSKLYQNQIMLKNLVIVLNRQIINTIKNHSNDDQENLVIQTWKIISTIMKSTLYNFKIIQNMIPSLALLIQLCNENQIFHLAAKVLCNSTESYDKPVQGLNIKLEELKSSNYAWKLNYEQVVFGQSILQSSIDEKIVIKLINQMFDWFYKKLFCDLAELVKQLEILQNEGYAVKIVEQKVKLWTKFQILFFHYFSFLKNSKKKSDFLSSVIHIIDSKQFKTISKLFLNLDEFLKLKLSPSTFSFKDEFFGHFKLILTSKYDDLNNCIGLLKISVFEILIIILDKIEQQKQIEKFNKKGYFLSVFRKQFIQKVLYDTFFVGQANMSKNEDIKFFISENKNLVMQEFNFLSVLMKNKNYSQLIIQTLRQNFNEKQFLFYGCICNVKFIEEDKCKMLDEDVYLINQLQDQSKFCVVSTFLSSILLFDDIFYKFVLNFAIQMVMAFISNQFKISQVLIKYEIQYQNQITLGIQYLLVYLYIIEQVSNLEKKIQIKELQNLIKLIQLFLEQQETNPNRFIPIVHLKIVSICRNIFKNSNLQKMHFNFIKIIELANQCKQNSGRYFNCLDQLKISILIILLQNHSLSKSFYLISFLFKQLTNKLRNINLNSNSTFFFHLSYLIESFQWNEINFSFDGNSVILEICCEKILEIKDSIDEIETNQLQEFLPKAQCFSLIKKCIYYMQAKFEISNQNHQLKMNQVRQIVIDILNFFKNYTKIMSTTQNNQLCEIIGVAVRSNFSEKISKQLNSIMRKDDRLVQEIMLFLQMIEQVNVQLIKCLENLLVGFEGLVCKKFLQKLIQRIFKVLLQITDFCINIDLISEIFKFINKIFFYEQDEVLSFSQWNEICVITANFMKQIHMNNMFKTVRQTQRILQNYALFIQTQIQFLQFQFFMASLHYHFSYSRLSTQPQLQIISFDNLMHQFKNLKKSMVLEDLALIIYAFENLVEQNLGIEQIRFLLKLSLRIIELRKKEMHLPLYLKIRYNPFEALKKIFRRLVSCQEEESQKIFDKKNIQFVLEELEKYHIVQDQPRRIISLKGHTNQQSQNTSQNLVDDIII